MKISFRKKVPATRIWQNLILRKITQSIYRQSDIKFSKRLKSNLAAYPDDDIGRDIALYGSYEGLSLQAIEQLIDAGIICEAKGGVFMDVGANVGIYSCMLHDRFGKILSFEPHPITYRLLQFNIESNSIKNVTAYPFALSDNNNKFKLYDAIADNRGAATFEESEGAESYEVSAAKGDDLVDGDEAGKISFMKIDVEGHEFETLVGCENLIKNSIPVIAFEANKPDKNKSVFDLLYAFGYTQFLVIDAETNHKHPFLRGLIHATIGKTLKLMEVTPDPDEKYSMPFAIHKSKNIKPYL